MTSNTEGHLFKSWHQALADGRLTSDQLKTLQNMVDSGQAESIENAARILDWQDGIIDADEHMYGF
jgi:hypothetical protein